jgi:eukaryotic-like serine/threonine-protein kinase
VADVHHDIELQAGSALGPYDLLVPIGEGGMARVWAARVRGKADVVAVKVLLPELSENVEFRKMFFDEASIASRVRHGNVCSTYEMGEQYGTLYLAMEWLDGPSLVRVLRPGRAEVTECERVPIRSRVAARIVADSCAGLHAAHELIGDDGRPLGVVHRDVSPHNLLLTCAGDVKITDFGVAKALGKTHMTIAGQLKGKLAYMAPEQLIGGTVDRRCDVFALGCVLYEITTGQRPFQGEHDPQVMASIVMGRYEPPATIVPGYPHELSIIVMRALANEPENRYASAEQMRQALENYLRNSGPPVGPAQVAELVRERCGLEMHERARVLRGEAPPLSRDTHGNAWSPAQGQAHAHANANAAFDSGSGPMMIDRRPSSSHRGVLWLAAAALVGASLGVGVLSYVRTVRRAKAHASATALAPPPSSATVTPAALPPAPASAPGPAGTGTTADPAAQSASATVPSASARVHLRITPSTAVVIVDGVVLPRGTDTITRPRDGAPAMNVLVRAEKHEDTIVLVDSATPDEVEVTLAANAAPNPSPRSAAVSQPGGGTGAGSARPRPSATAKDGPPIDAPPNPYD